MHSFTAAMLRKANAPVPSADCTRKRDILWIPILPWPTRCIPATKIVYVDDVVSVNGTKTDEIKNSRIVVEIKGEVVYPGIYEFDTNEVLIQDVINMAGGLTKRADTSLINLASLVSNHSSITIGSIESKSYVLGEGEIQNKININTCTVEELESLEGIGESKAIQIINYRKVNGFFQTIEDIKNVSGVGDAVYQKIKDYITV